jgi:hypothetical protein
MLILVTFRCIDDVLSLNNNSKTELVIYVDPIYPIELEIKDPSLDIASLVWATHRSKHIMSCQYAISLSGNRRDVWWIDVCCQLSDRWYVNVVWPRFYDKLFNNRKTLSGDRQKVSPLTFSTRGLARDRHLYLLLENDNTHGHFLFSNSRQYPCIRNISPPSVCHQTMFSLPRMVFIITIIIRY